MKSTLIWATVKASIGLLLLIFGVRSYIDGSSFGTVVMLFFGLGLVVVAYTDLRKYLAEKQSACFTSQCEEDIIEKIDSVLSAENVESVINDYTFSCNDVRMLAGDYKEQWAMVLTGDCVYEKHAQSYRNVTQGLRDVKFRVGSEYTPSRRETVDVERIARSGYFAGGLGVAAMNAADAMKMNAEGGRLTSGGSYFPVDLKSGGDSSGIHVVIIRNDLLKKFGTPYIYTQHKEKGRYFTAFYICMDNRATADKCAKELTKYMRTISK